MRNMFQHVEISYFPMNNLYFHVYNINYILRFDLLFWFRKKCLYMCFFQKKHIYIYINSISTY